MVLQSADIRALLEVVERTGKPAIVDWSNRVINVLSDPIPHRLSTESKPLTYQEYLFQINERIES